MKAMSSMPSRQLGLFGLGGLFSGKKKTKSEQRTERTTTATVTEDRERGLTGTEQQLAEVRLLDADVKDALSGLVGALIGAQQEGGAAQNIGNVAQLLLERGVGAEEAIGANTEAIINEARRIGERELLSTRTRLAQAAGGTTANTFVAGATAEGRAALESQLAALRAQLGIQARGIETEELSNVAQLFSTGAAASAAESNALAQLLNILRGATQQTQVTGTRTEDERVLATQNIVEILNELIRGKTTTKDKPSLFSSALSLLTALPRDSGN